MKRALLTISAALALAACSGDSSTGGGTADSPFVGTYKGSSTARVSATAGTRTANESITVFVNRDGLVQIGNADSTIYASGPLDGDRVRISGNAAALVDTACTGTITLTGTFSLSGPDGATFDGSWTSENTTCFGTPGELRGPIEAQRIGPDARASRVFETNSPALLEAFRRAAG